ncbi:hypothetical protein Vadar_004536 [Vaccinium darrowii]|uniref:Uncharacterized protein n=1 Tax=Vaccinium darrowii TaxID=229202 RepID=A0ACB7WXX2_9ERIC|nr:hypothetical protein Vadar_004536 [Vaccinium darrowii]
MALPTFAKFSQLDPLDRQPQGFEPLLHFSILSDRPYPITILGCLLFVRDKFQRQNFSFHSARMNDAVRLLRFGDVSTDRKWCYIVFWVIGKPSTRWGLFPPQSLLMFSSKDLDCVAMTEEAFSMLCGLPDIEDLAYGKANSFSQPKATAVIVADVS